MCRSHHHKHHGRFGVLRVIAFTIVGTTAALGLAALFGIFVTLLWNWLLPTIFGITTITFLQGVGIAVLARLLFGGFGPRGFGHRGGWHGWGGHGWDARGGKRGHRHHGGRHYYASPERWEAFHSYWEAEGRQAFDEYLKREGDANALNEEPESEEVPTE